MAGLDQAAQDGDVDALYAEIRKNPSVLDMIDNTQFIDSSLHIAARLGHAHFALEIVMMKPSLARKLDDSCQSPMHLAVMNGHQELVKGFLSIDKDLIRVKGKEGRTPLHCVAATEGVSSLLYNMLSVCPDAIGDLTFRRETVLHLAVKHNNFDAFCVLIEFIEKFNKQVVYISQDEERRTALHHAISLRQLEMVRFLFNKYSYRTWKLGVDLKDNNDQTVQDLIKVFQEEDSHRNGGSSQNPLLLELNGRHKWRWQLRGLRKVNERAFQNSPTKNLDAMLVVLALVMTVTMQIGVSPPGGFWQDDGKTKDGKKYSAGHPIIATTSPIFYNMMTIVGSSVFMILLMLIMQFTAYMPMKNIVRFVLILFELTYFSSIGVNISDQKGAVVGMAVSWICVYIYSFFDPEEA